MGDSLVKLLKIKVQQGVFPSDATKCFSLYFLCTRHICGVDIRKPITLLIDFDISDVFLDLMIFFTIVSFK